MEKKAGVRRRALISENPEALAELVGMEIQRGNSRLYSCKLCGIQAMNLFDAESHIKEEDHVILKAEDVIGTMPSADPAKLQPCGMRVLIECNDAEESSAGGVLLTEAAKERPLTGRVVASVWPYGKLSPSIFGEVKCVCFTQSCKTFKIKCSCIV